MPHRRGSTGSVSEACTTSSTRSAKTKRYARKRRAKQWTYYMETLKSTVDCLYEMCRSEQSVDGCKEASMYLSACAKDFDSLIESINVELNWSSDDRPQAVAWEVRKTMSSPSHALQESLLKPNKTSLIDSLPISPMVLAEVVRSVEKTRDKTDTGPVVTDDVEANEGDEKGAGDEWKVVTSRTRRRKSASSTASEPPASTEIETDAVSPQKALSVYERLSGSSSCQRHAARNSSSEALGSSRGVEQRRGSLIGGTRLMCPKSAMDLPQTKASMAKIAYSRQLLWQKHQVSLTEKLEKMKARHRRERLLPTSRSTTSINSSPRHATCGIKFADPQAVKKSAAAFQQQRQKKQLTPKSESMSLSSIKETAEENTGVESGVESKPEVEDVPADPRPTSPPSSTLTSTFAECRSEPIMPSAFQLNMEDDDEWREMTEEEESLAFEERSLHKEIEEETASIDAELERQVAAEADAADWLPDNEDEVPIEDVLKTADVPLSFTELLSRIEQEMKSQSWSEIMERECKGRYREPGEGVQKHERLSSPSRCRLDREGFPLRHAEKMRSADALREKLQAEKAARLKELTSRVEEVRKKKEELAEKKRKHLEACMEKMERAKENREKNITDIVRKAKDDEQKVLEIAFINTVEAENKRIDLMTRDEHVEERMQTLKDERERRKEEKAAKEHAVEERRKAAEMQRLNQIQERLEKKEARQAVMSAQKTEQERERRERMRHHMERVAVLKAAGKESPRESECSSPMTPLEKESSYLKEALSMDDWVSPKEDGSKATCSRCGDELDSSASSILGHVLSAEHLKVWAVSPFDVDDVLLESELNGFVSFEIPKTETPRGCADDRRLDAKHKSKLLVRSKRLEERLSKVECTLDEKTGALDRVHRDLASMGLPSAARIGEAALRTFERALGDFIKKFDATIVTKRSAFVVDAWRSGSLAVVASWAFHSTCTQRLLTKACQMLSRCASERHSVAALIVCGYSVPFCDKLLCANESELAPLFELWTLCVKKLVTVPMWSQLSLTQKDFLSSLESTATILVENHWDDLFSSYIVSGLRALAIAFVSTFAQIPLSEKCRVLLSSCSNALLKLCSRDRSDAAASTVHFIHFWSELISKKIIQILLSTRRERSVLLCRVLRLIFVYWSEFTSDDLLVALDAVTEFAGSSPYNQLLCRLGGDSSLLGALSRLPLPFVANSEKKAHFLPALLSCTLRSPFALQIMKQEISPAYIIAFLQEAEKDESLMKTLRKEELKSVFEFYSNSP